METIVRGKPNFRLVESMLNATSSGFASFDSNFNFQKFNSFFTEYLSLDESISCLDKLYFFKPEDLMLIKQGLVSGKFQDQPFEKRVTNNKTEENLLLKIYGVSENSKLNGGFIQIDKSYKAQTKCLSEEAKVLDLNLYNNSPLGLIKICNAEAKILNANPRFCRMLGYTEKELQTMTAYDITHPEDKKRHTQVFSENIDGEEKKNYFEKRYIKKNGQSMWVNIAVTVVSGDNGLPLYDLAMVQDISEKKKASEIIEKQIQELHFKNQQLEQYIESNLQLENFAYIASHDLKAPLRTIGNFTQILKRRIGDTLKPEELEYIDFILDGTKDMNQLIEDLLSYSKINSMDNTVTKLDLPHVLNNVQRNMDAVISDTSAEIILENIPPSIYANKTKITQLFQNLIANGIKFRAKDTKPCIQLSCEDKNQYWQFQVKDNGIGIEKEYFDRIFGLFKRLHGKSEFDGSGIGLAYCKRVVEKHDGEIWLESEVGKGTSFFFTIKKEDEELKRTKEC